MPPRGNAACLIEIIDRHGWPGTPRMAGFAASPYQGGDNSGGLGRAVVEVNAAWGAGVYGCEPAGVPVVIDRSGVAFSRGRPRCLPGAHR